MLRPLLLALALTGVIVACSFHGPDSLGGDASPQRLDGAVRGDASLGDGAPPPSDGRPVDAMADARPVDAARDATASDPCTANAAACANAGGMCVGGTCTITVATNVPGKITCPAGMPCDVECLADGACQSGIDCTMATTCLIDCLGNNTCVTGRLDGSTQTSVLCRGLNSCDNDGLTAPNSSGSCVAHCCAVGTCNNFSLTHCSTTSTGC